MWHHTDLHVMHYLESMCLAFIDVHVGVPAFSSLVDKVHNTYIPSVWLVSGSDFLVNTIVKALHFAGPMSYICFPISESDPESDSVLFWKTGCIVTYFVQTNNRDIVSFQFARAQYHSKHIPNHCSSPPCASLVGEYEYGVLLKLLQEASF